MRIDREELKTFCVEKLESIEKILDETTSFTFAPMLKLRLMAKKNILKHLVDYNTCFNFANTEQLNQYIEDSADIVCGFYEH